MIARFLPAAACAALITLLLGPATAGGEALDAVSAASMTVKVTQITSTSATVEWSKDSYDYGYRTLCYDPAPAAAKNNCKRVEVDDDKGSIAISGLKPATKYNFRVEATDPDDDEDPYSVSGNFTTATPPVAVGRAPVPAADAAWVDRGVRDALGRSQAGRGKAGSPAFAPRTAP
jgi:hypothetical protein